MIGQISEPDANGKLVTVHNQQSLLAEAYRMLRVNLDFAAIDRPLGAIAVTSGGPEEGKSTTITIELPKENRQAAIRNDDEERSLSVESQLNRYLKVQQGDSKVSS